MVQWTQENIFQEEICNFLPYPLTFKQNWKGANLGAIENEKRPGKLGNTRMYCTVEGRIMTCLKACIVYKHFLSQPPFFSDKKKINTDHV